jgi:hypothetical protein
MSPKGYRRTVEVGERDLDTVVQLLDHLAEGCHGPDRKIELWAESVGINHSEVCLSVNRVAESVGMQLEWGADSAEVSR